MALAGLATAAVGFAAENILATIVGNAGEQVFVQARQGKGRWGDGEMGRWGDGEMGSNTMTAEQWFNNGGGIRD